ETVHEGGVDYECISDYRDPFLLEVTHLDRDAVTDRSGWPDKLDDTVRMFSQITPKLYSKAKAKASQLADYDVARVLAITLTHVGAGALLGNLAARWLMLSEPKIAFPIAEGGLQPLQTSQQVTDLKYSVFFKGESGTIVPTRRSISAILLVAIWDDQLE